MRNRRMSKAGLHRASNAAGKRLRNLKRASVRQANALRRMKRVPGSPRPMRTKNPKFGKIRRG